MVLPTEVLSHRIFWSATVLILILTFQGNIGRAIAAVQNFRYLLLLSASAVLITINWLTYIWAIDHEMLLQTSLGYFINPLVNVFLGYVFLKEKLSGLKWASILLALCGVLIMGLYFFEIPTVALILAFTFGAYGLLRKIVPVDSISGLALETCLISPFALAYFVYLDHTNALSFLHSDILTNFLLASAGLISALPLIWFVKATRILTYATIGILMYVWPTMAFFIAIFIFGEPFHVVQLIGFIFIWVSLGLYTWQLIIEERQS
jgi:chloramphenicol-sensitive protein RarD